jgi:ribonucleoside-diphosphate reductase alpha chain
MEKARGRSPSDVPDLHDLFGAAFEQAYVAYEAKAARGEIKPRPCRPWTCGARCSMLFETGHPWITFKDACNCARRSSTWAWCTPATCAPRSRSTPATRDGGVQPGLGQPAAPHQGRRHRPRQAAATVQTAMRMLDNVIDINYYAVKKARDSNLRHRPVGLG